MQRPARAGGWGGGQLAGAPVQLRQGCPDSSEEKQSSNLALPEKKKTEECGRWGGEGVEQGSAAQSTLPPQAAALGGARGQGRAKLKDNKESAHTEGGSQGNKMRQGW